MTKGIEFDSAQGEVCDLVWDVFEALQTKTLDAVDAFDCDSENQIDIESLVFLTSRAGQCYRYHAENDFKIK